MDVINRELYAGKITSSPRCPRCGYGLEGMLGSYKEACPLKGKCSECGFEFEWVMVMWPDRRLPEWLFEYCIGRKAALITTFKTWFRTIVPPLFFSEVRLWHEPKIRRLAKWLAIQLMWMYVLATGVRLLHMWLVLQSFVGNPGNGMVFLGNDRYAIVGREDWVQYANEFLVPIGELRYPQYYWGTPPPAAGTWHFQFHEFGTASIFVISTCAAWPLALFLLRPTRKLARVRNAHVLRATMYSLSWVFVLLWMRVAWSILCSLESMWIMCFSPGSSMITEKIKESLLPWNFYVTPIAILEDVGLRWSAAVTILGAAILLWQGWWWYTVMRKHWRLPQARTAWLLLVVIAICIAVLATIGQMSYRYMFA